MAAVDGQPVPSGNPELAEPDTDGNSDSEEEVNTPSTEEAVPRINVTEQAVIPPQSTVGPPQLPNLAQEALRRLRDNKREEESPGDFRPLKKKRLHAPAKVEDREDDVDEVVNVMYSCRYSISI